MVGKKMAGLLLAGLISGAFFGGCGSSVESICQRMCDCRSKCTDQDLQKCISEGQAEQTSAEKHGCGDTFDQLLSCASNASCKGDELDLDACEALADQAEHCGGDDQVTNGSGSDG